ncbi:MAG: hypothetical protein AAF591_22465, partial [Verrucomicrobiota bacterium]
LDELVHLSAKERAQSGDRVRGVRQAGVQLLPEALGVALFTPSPLPPNRRTEQPINRLFLPFIIILILLLILTASLCPLPSPL